MRNNSYINQINKINFKNIIKNVHQLFVFLEFYFLN